MALALSAMALADGPVSPLVVFEEVTDPGFRFVVEPSRTPHRHQPETMISGIALFDADGDGRLGRTGSSTTACSGTAAASCSKT